MLTPLFYTQAKVVFGFVIGNLTLILSLKKGEENIVKSENYFVTNIYAWKQHDIYIGVETYSFSQGMKSIRYEFSMCAIMAALAV